MKKRLRYVLVLNSGSSSLKYMLVDMRDETVIKKGLIDRLGSSVESRTDVVARVLKSMPYVDVIGHRIVHGGERFKRATLIDAKVLKTIKRLIPLAPLHMPHNVQGVEICKRIFPDKYNVAVFDTAFHETMPPSAYLYAVDMKFYSKYGIRKYGFHGMSYEYITEWIERRLNKNADRISIIACHLGNGASVAAIKNGKCLDTSMGFSPLQGLVMGTRCGDIDVSAALAMARARKWNIDKLEHYLNSHSGLAGLSGTCDMRDLCSRIDRNDTVAKVAMDVYIHRIVMYIGGYNALLDGADALVFTGGIGENSSYVRERVISRLNSLGIVLNKKANQRPSKYDGLISSEDSDVQVYVCRTNEELMIARDTIRAIRLDGNRRRQPRPVHQEA